MTTFTYPTQAELLILIAKTKFEPFNEGDWFCFAGCESDNPFIGYSDEFTIVLDGHLINIIHSEDSYGGQLFGMNQLA
jgi:hypothetical protein